MGQVRGKGKNVTIYVPDDLFRRMETLSDANWSEVCRRAIANYIDTRTNVNIEALVARLKEEKSREFVRGYRLAYEVSKEASYREIAGLVEGWEDIRDEITSLPLKDSSVDEEGAGALRNQEWRRYWRKSIPLLHDTPLEINEEFVEGFVNGLYEIYQKVTGVGLPLR